MVQQRVQRTSPKLKKKTAQQEGKALKIGSMASRPPSNPTVVVQDMADNIQSINHAGYHNGYQQVDEEPSE